MPHYCIIPGCRSNSRINPELSFHKFPSNLFHFNVWKTSIVNGLESQNCQGLENFKPQFAEKVCDKHFLGGKRSPRHNIPTIFSIDVIALRSRDNVKEVPLPMNTTPNDTSIASVSARDGLVAFPYDMVADMSVEGSLSSINQIDGGKKPSRKRKRLKTCHYSNSQLPKTDQSGEGKSLTSASETVIPVSIAIKKECISEDGYLSDKVLSMETDSILPFNEEVSESADPLKQESTNLPLAFVDSCPSLPTSVQNVGYENACTKTEPTNENQMSTNENQMSTNLTEVTSTCVENKPKSQSVPKILKKISISNNFKMPEASKQNILENKYPLKYSFKLDGDSYEACLTCKICVKDFQMSEESFVQHMKCHFGWITEENEWDKVKILCADCFKVFPAIDDLLFHQRILYNERHLYPCGVCQVAFLTTADFKRHFLTHFCPGEKSGIVFCLKCKVGISSKVALSEHVFSKHLHRKMCYVGNDGDFDIMPFCLISSSIAKNQNSGAIKQAGVLKTLNEVTLNPNGNTSHERVVNACANNRANTINENCEKGKDKTNPQLTKNKELIANPCQLNRININRVSENIDKSKTNQDVRPPNVKTYGKRNPGNLKSCSPPATVVSKKNSTIKSCSTIPKLNASKISNKVACPVRPSLLTINSNGPKHSDLVSEININVKRFLEKETTVVAAFTNSAINETTNSTLKLNKYVKIASKDSIKSVAQNITTSKPSKATPKKGKKCDISNESMIKTSNNVNSSEILKNSNSYCYKLKTLASLAKLSELSPPSSVTSITGNNNEVTPSEPSNKTTEVISNQGSTSAYSPVIMKNSATYTRSILLSKICDICGLSCSLREMTLHNKNNPYVWSCTLCSNKYHYKASLEIHLQSHFFNLQLNFVDVVCNDCPSRFARSRDFAQHITSKHECKALINR